MPVLQAKSAKLRVISQSKHKPLPALGHHRNVLIPLLSTYTYEHA